ncbi:hypothetical protein [Curtobacterium sp. MCSS17_016]|uniref:hypothetical protein n=1 Tax=Curtobacterium sp. MCSS17_016 TaxID=2175644 RepID=UPI000DA78D2C|nr:hypothetical protein [Curtobacterium sp. MCSS17_016]WIE81043.1 hypothetical protein DEJ19_021235 [Curtobacterium sp. MCSS17_016]
MPTMINTELTSWTGDTIIGPSGDVYRLDDDFDTGLDVRVWVWNAKTRDLDQLDTPAGTTPKTRDEALAVIEVHSLAALAAKEPTAATDDDKQQDELRKAAAQQNRYFAGVLTAADKITDESARQSVLNALDEYRADAFDGMIHEYWVFPGVPIGKVKDGFGNDSALELAERAAADWAEKTHDQATVVSVRSERNPDGSAWSPATYFQWQGVRGVTEEQLRKNEPTERFDG